MVVSTRIMNKPTLWQSEKWHEKLKLAENEDGAHYTVEQVNAFPVPEREALLAFINAVQNQTKECLNGMTPEGLDRKFPNPRGGEVAIAGLFMFTISHAAGHTGEMSYLRGLQRGMDK